jgi:hypothetical protein
MPGSSSMRVCEVSNLTINRYKHSQPYDRVLTGTNRITSGSNSGYFPIVRDSLAIKSYALENVSDEVFRAPKAVAPLCVGGGGRLGGDNFVERLALFLEGRHFLASANQQVAVERELRFVANRAVP